MNKRIKIWIITGILPLLMAGACYSFKDAAIDPNIKTFKVAYFDNKAAEINPKLSQAFTERLKDEILAQSNLDEIDQNPDVEFSGYIATYTINPIAPKAGESSSMSRLTISVYVNYINHVNEKNAWQNTFSRYADFDATQTLTAVEDQLIEEINNQLVDDIFRKAFVNW